MKNLMKFIFQLAIILILFFLLPVDSFAQGPPPPPGVPIDGGLSILVAAAVGYGVVKVRQNNSKTS